MQSVCFLSALEQARLLRRRKISARELLKLSRERVEKYNPAINAVVVSDFARGGEGRGRRRSPPQARRAARHLRRRADDHQGVLRLGGHAIDLGCAELAGQYRRPKMRGGQAPYRYRRDLFGKTNVPLMLADWQSFNDIYGTTNNPWDLRARRADPRVVRPQPLQPV